MFFSDGAAFQFKQRFTLCEITLSAKSLSWNFFTTGHGKGAVDGIGGTLKRDVHTAAFANNIVIKSIDDFSDVASETSTKINVLACSKKQVQASATQIDHGTVGISAIPATQKMHSLKLSLLLLLKQRNTIIKMQNLCILLNCCKKAKLQTMKFLFLLQKNLAS